MGAIPCKSRNSSRRCGIFASDIAGENPDQASWCPILKPGAGWSLKRTKRFFIFPSRLLFESLARQGACWREPRARGRLSEGADAKASKREVTVTRPQKTQPDISAAAPRAHADSITPQGRAINSAPRDRDAGQALRAPSGSTGQAQNRQGVRPDGDLNGPGAADVGAPVQPPTDETADVVDARVKPPVRQGEGHDERGDYGRAPRNGEAGASSDKT